MKIFLIFRMKIYQNRIKIYVFFSPVKCLTNMNGIHIHIFITAKDNQFCIIIWHDLQRRNFCYEIIGIVLRIRGFLSKKSHHYSTIYPVTLVTITWIFSMLCLLLLGDIYNLSIGTTVDVHKKQVQECNHPQFSTKIYAMQPRDDQPCIKKEKLKIINQSIFSYITEFLACYLYIKIHWFLI